MSPITFFFSLKSHSVTFTKDNDQLKLLQVFKPCQQFVASSGMKTLSYAKALHPAYYISMHEVTQQSVIMTIAQAFLFTSIVQMSSPTTTNTIRYRAEIKLGKFSTELNNKTNELKGVSMNQIKQFFLSKDRTY